VAVRPGQSIAAGQRVVVLEAMKMEQQVVARRAGIVATVAVQVGDQVAPGQSLVRIEGQS
jgi:biotin carboxyl carrier protein